MTVPQPGGPPEELWQRFCTALGIDPAWAPLESDRRNPSIGVAESTLLRRLNARLKEAGLPSDQYRALVRQLVVHETLAAAAADAAGDAAAGRLRLGRGGRAGLDRLGQGRRASTWSATSTSCARSARRPAPSGTTRTGRGRATSPPRRSTRSSR